MVLQLTMWVLVWSLVCLCVHLAHQSDMATVSDVVEIRHADNDTHCLSLCQDKNGYVNSHSIIAFLLI